MPAGATLRELIRQPGSKPALPALGCTEPAALWTRGRSSSAATAVSRAIPDTVSRLAISPVGKVPALSSRPNTAMAIAPPICRLVLNTPDATPPR